MSRKTRAQRQQDADDAWSDGTAPGYHDRHERWAREAAFIGPRYPPHLPKPRSKPAPTSRQAALERALEQIDRAFGKRAVVTAIELTKKP